MSRETASFTDMETPATKKLINYLTALNHNNYNKKESIKMTPGSQI